jgi:hypothetical protein
VKLKGDEEERKVNHRMRRKKNRTDANVSTREYLMIICHRMEHKTGHFSCREMVSWFDKKNYTTWSLQSTLIQQLQCVRLRLFNETFTIVVFFSPQFSSLILTTSHVIVLFREIYSEQKKVNEKKGIQRQ